MKIASLMCAVWMGLPLAFQAAVAAESSGAPLAARAQSHGSTRVRPAQGAVPQGTVPQAAVLKGGNAATAVSQRPAAAQVLAGPLTRNNADRLHSQLRTEVRPVAKPP